MSIARLQSLAGRQMPFNALDEFEIDELRVLVAAGLIAALRLCMAGKDGRSVPMVRVLAITPAGRQLLRRAGEGSAWPDADVSAHLVPFAMRLRHADHPADVRLPQE